MRMPEKLLYNDLDFGLDLDSRVALVGPNGAGKRPIDMRCCQSQSSFEPGKSTLLRLCVGDLTPTDGRVSRNTHLRIGWYHQHLADMMDLDKSAISWMLEQFPDYSGGRCACLVTVFLVSFTHRAPHSRARTRPHTSQPPAGVEGMRSKVGRFGLTGKAQTCPMRNLSDGQRSRVVFAWLAWRAPHMLLVRET